MMERFDFEPGVIFNLELPAPYWFALTDSVRAMQDMAKAYQSRSSA
jgi:hypothetical protein